MSCEHSINEEESSKAIGGQTKKIDALRSRMTDRYVFVLFLVAMLNTAIIFIVLLLCWRVIQMSKRK